MKVLATILMMIPIALCGQEKMNDLEHWEDEETYTFSWGYDFDWSIIEVWNDDKLIYTSKAITRGKAGRYVIIKQSLDLKQWSTMTVFVTRSRHGLIFRDSINIVVPGKKLSKFRSPATSSN